MLALRPWNPRVNQEGDGPEGSLPGVMIHDLLSPLTLSCPLMTHIPVSLWGSAHLHNILRWEYGSPVSSTCLSGSSFPATEGQIPDLAFKSLFLSPILSLTSSLTSSILSFILPHSCP